MAFSFGAKPTGGGNAPIGGGNAPVGGGAATFAFAAAPSIPSAPPLNIGGNGGGGGGGGITFGAKPNGGGNVPTGGGGGGGGGGGITFGAKPNGGGNAPSGNVPMGGGGGGGGGITFGATPNGGGNPPMGVVGGGGLNLAKAPAPTTTTTTTTNATTAPSQIAFNNTPVKQMNNNTTLATAKTTTNNTNNRTIDPNMQSKTIAEIAQEWTSILNKQTHKFKQSCKKVKAWDDFLLQMHYDLNIYSKHTTRQISELDELNSSLTSMRDDHANISNQLDITLKNVREKIRDVTGKNETAADKEREINYGLAEKVNREVMGLTDELKRIVNELNQVQEKRFGNGNKGMSQIEHIEQIVDKHLRTLEQIDQKTDQIAQSLGATEQINHRALQMRMN